MEDAKAYSIVGAGLAACFAFYLGMKLISMRFKLPKLRNAGFRLAVFGVLLVVMHGLGIYTREVESQGVVLEAAGPKRGQWSVLRNCLFQ